MVIGSGSISMYSPGGFWSRTAPRISSRSSRLRNARTRYSRSWSASSGSPSSPTGSVGRMVEVANRSSVGVESATSDRSDCVTMPRLSVATLTGRHVSLEPLALEHVDALGAAGAGDRSTFGYTQVPDGPDQAADYVRWLLDDAAHDRAAPFAQRRLADDTIVGCTRFLHPLWPLDREHPDEVEIGGTWLAVSAQRTAVNTEAKLLLLTHAFESWDAQRVAICTDARNTKSRRAIERLGASFEGVLRRHRRSTRAGDGTQLRDTAAYAITIDDWPAVRTSLGEHLGS